LHVAATNEREKNRVRDRQIADAGFVLVENLDKELVDGDFFFFQEVADRRVLPAER
jgi:hypothetical protein